MTIFLFGSDSQALKVLSACISVQQTTLVCPDHPFSPPLKNDWNPSKQLGCFLDTEGRQLVQEKEK